MLLAFVNPTLMASFRKFFSQLLVWVTENMSTLHLDYVGAVRSSHQGIRQHDNNVCAWKGVVSSERAEFFHNIFFFISHGSKIR